MFQLLGWEFTRNECTDAEKHSLILGAPHSPHPHMLQKLHPVHSLGNMPWITFLRISTKFPDSKTCETLKIEALLPRESVEFCSVEIELQNFKAQRSLPSPLLPKADPNFNPRWWILHLLTRCSFPSCIFHSPDMCKKKIYISLTQSSSSSFHYLFSFSKQQLCYNRFSLSQCFPVGEYIT